jgi:hypothetical protein
VWVAGFSAAACGDAPAASESTSTHSRFEAALSVEDPLERARELASALEVPSSESSNAALAAVERRIGAVRAEDARWIALAAGRVDPVATLERIRNWPLRLRASAADAVMEDWARRAPDSAVAWFRSQADFDLSVALIRGWAAGDFESALRFVASQPKDAAFGTRVRALVGVLCARAFEAESPNRCADQLERRNDLSPALRRRALVAAVAEEAAVDPVGAAAWLTPRVGSVDLIGALDALVSEWQLVDPAGAVSWLESLPPGADRNAALERLSRAWRLQDPEAFTGWQRERRGVPDSIAPVPAARNGARSEK